MNRFRMVSTYKAEIRKEEAYYSDINDVTDKHDTVKYIVKEQMICWSYLYASTNSVSYNILGNTVLYFVVLKNAELLSLVYGVSTVCQGQLSQQNQWMFQLVTTIARTFAIKDNATLKKKNKLRNTPRNTTVSGVFLAWKNPRCKSVWARWDVSEILPFTERLESLFNLKQGLGEFYGSKNIMFNRTLSNNKTLRITCKQNMETCLPPWQFLAEMASP